MILWNSTDSEESRIEKGLKSQLMGISGNNAKWSFQSPVSLSLIWKMKHYKSSVLFLCLLPIT